MKLKRLGIDAVQVNVPKSSPEEIKKSLLVTSRTKWLYNNEEHNTKYISLSQEDSRRVYETDDLQRRLFEEGFKCRSAQIGELIRSIEKLLESESYLESERYLKSEIQRVTKITEGTQSELEFLREEHIRKGIEQHQERRKEFQNYTSNLERRYKSKRSRVEEEIRKVEDETNRIISIINNTKTEPSHIESIEIQRRIKSEIESEIESIQKSQEEFIVEFRENERTVRSDFDRERQDIEEQYKIEEERIEQDIRSIQQNLGTIQETFRISVTKAKHNFETTRRKLETDIQTQSEYGSGIRTRIKADAKEFRIKCAEILKLRRRENEEIRKKFIKNSNDHNFEEVSRDKFITNRIPDFEKTARNYSQYLILHRRLVEKYKY